MNNNDVSALIGEKKNDFLSLCFLLWLLMNYKILQYVIRSIF